VNNELEKVWKETVVANFEISLDVWVCHRDKPSES